MKGERKITEEEEHAQAAEGPEGYVEALIAAGEVIAYLKGRLKCVKQRYEQKEFHEQKERLHQPAFDSSLVNTHSNLSSRSQNLTSVVKVNLPKIQLPNFEGNVQQWTEFWDMFKTCVDEQNISKACKFNYLKSVLKGAAAAAIPGISICDDNYDDAVALLKEQFGQEEVIIESLYAKLQSLPKSCNKFTEVRQTYQSIEKVLRQLEAQGEAINNQRILIKLVLSKFPSEVIVKLEESKQPTKGWNTEDLRTAILQYIRIQENVYRYSGQLPPVYNGKGQGQFTSQTHNTGCFPGQLPPVYNGKGRQPQVNSVEVFSSVSGRRVMRPCIFCSGSYYNDQCNEYVSLTDRKKRLTEQGRCFVCLKTGHYLKNCPSLKKRCCDHCGKQGYHNRCLCPVKFPEKISNNDNAEAFCSTDSNGVTSLPPDSRLSEEVQLKDDHLTYATESLLASGERVLLQTAVVPIFSSDGQTLINSRVLLDSASQRIFMTTKLAQQLKLQFCQREHLSVSTFGAEKMREIDTHVVNFKMKAKDGS